MAKLWNKEIAVDEQISLLEDFSSYLEVSMLVTIEKFKSIIILQKSGWLNVARDFLTDTLPEVCDEVGQYLVKSKLMNPPNWKIFLKDRLEIAKEAGQAIYSYHDKCFQICAAQYQQQYQATYEQELAKQDGLGFGIISSSLAAHLVYAAQSASKERQNEKKASDAADRIMQSSLGPVEKAAQMTIAFYHEKFDPFVNDFLIGFYSDIERLIYDGLDVDKETLDNNKVLSGNELSDITEDNHRERITASLSIYPFNGDALFWAVRYDDADSELIEFCSNNPLLLPKYLVAFEQSAVAYLKKQKEKADLYNRDPLTEDIVQLLHRIRAFLTDERMCGVSTYDNIIQEVYGERIDLTCDKFAPLLKIQKNESSLANYARDHKTLNLSQNDFETLQRYNAIFGTSKIKAIFDIIPDSLEDFNKMLLELGEAVKLENVKHQEAEKQRKQRERELAEQKQKEEEQRKAEEQRQKEIHKAQVKRKIKIGTAIVVSLIAVILLFNIFAMPPIYYGIATNRLQEQQYSDAAILYAKAGNYKDAKELTLSAWAKVPNKLVASGDGTFGMALKENGKVVAAGNNNYGQCNVGAWNNIISVSAGCYHAVGLTSNGIVVAVGENSSGECNVAGWKNIVAISAGYSHTVGLKSDGTVVATGENDWGQCNVDGWKNIIAIAAGDYHTVGLKKDGTVVSTKITRGEGANRAGTPYFGQTDVSAWTNIIAIDANEFQTIGLKDDGTVVSTIIDSSVYSVWQPYYHNQDKLSNWKNIIAISLGRYHVVGLKSDGTVVSTQFVNGDWGDEGQCEVSSWKNIVAVAAGADFTIGIKSDGTSIIAGHIDTSWYTTPGTIPQKYWDNATWSGLKQPYKE